MQLRKGSSSSGQGREESFIALSPQISKFEHFGERGSMQ